MDDLRVGVWVRSERRRLGLRQTDLGVLAGVSASTVSRVENGHVSELTVRVTRAVAAAVGIQLPFAPRSLRGAAIERQVDWRHATLVESVVGRLSRLGWESVVEYSFNHYGDRGSVDVLSWNSEARALLVVEVKSDLRNLQQTLHALDVKRRVVPRLVRAENGWKFDFVGVVMVLADLRAERHRIERHESTFDAGLPARTVEVKRWLARPVGPLRGLWFLPIPRPVGAIRQSAGHGRVRRVPGFTDGRSGDLRPNVVRSVSVSRPVPKPQRRLCTGLETAADEKDASSRE